MSLRQVFTDRGSYNCCSYDLLLQSFLDLILLLPAYEQLKPKVETDTMGALDSLLDVQLSVC